MTDAARLRRAILAADLASSSHGDQPTAGTLYIPPSHIKALRLDAHVVVGGRGVGKSFWTAALQTETLRAEVRTTVRDLEGIETRVGFAIKDSSAYPNPDGFRNLRQDGIDPYDIWRAVVLRWIAGKTDESAIPASNWVETVKWLRECPEEVVNLLERPRSWRGLIVFDELDRTSKDWREMDEIVRGLLRAMLWLKSQPGLYAKVFLREDQAQRTVFDFPDASKLLATKAELSWARHDLHGLLWQRLINTPGEDGARLREVCKVEEKGGVWLLPETMKRETDDQREAFASIAGPWMGKDKRRGVPYHWSVSHLADGRGQTSPRSFLAAIRAATEDSEERYPDHPFAIHYESIKRGIQKASEIRVDEIAEDYNWVRPLLEPLKGQLVPCAFSDILERWHTHFPKGPESISSDKLPPQHTDRGWEDIRSELQRLGLLETRADGRIDMPDLYRVGFGLGRKGGVKLKG